MPFRMSQRAINRLRLLLIALCFGVGVVCHAADADHYPAKTIKMLVPFPPGGATDRMARLVGQRLASNVGQPVIIENQPGGAGIVAARSVAGANPDGHTLLFTGVGAFLVRPLLLRSVDFDPISSFSPIATVATVSSVLVVSPDVPFRNIPELVASAKASPGKLTYGSAIGIAPHLMMELFKFRTGTDIVHVPYKGGAQVLADLMAGHIQMTINDKSVLLQFLGDGRLRALAVTSTARWPELPDVPTMIESGIADMPTDIWMGLFAPANTPAAVVGRLNSVINDGLRSAEMREQFAKAGFETKAGTPQDFAVLIASDTRKWAKIVKLTGVKVD